MGALMTIENVSMTFQMKKNLIGGPAPQVHALSEVNLEIPQGSIVAVVGESGCGKTTLGKAIVGLQKPTGGRILYDGEDLYNMSGDHFAQYRKQVQMVMQDSFAALNPMRSVGQALAVPLQKLGIVKGRKAARDRVIALLESVGLVPGEQFLAKYPHQLSGGQRQRVCLARAISLSPRLIVADEPVSGVDVSSRLSILKLMSSLNKELGIAFVYITHDLSTARYIAGQGKLAVMYLGRLVEFGDLQSVLDRPRHPYLRALLTAVPAPDPDLARNRPPLPLKDLDLPDATRLPSGCSFHPRCPLAAAGRCEQEVPQLHMVGASAVACHFADMADIS